MGASNPLNHHTPSVVVHTLLLYSQRCLHTCIFVFVVSGAWQTLLTACLVTLLHFNGVLEERAARLASLNSLMIPVFKSVVDFGACSIYTCFVMYRTEYILSKICLSAHLNVLNSLLIDISLLININSTVVFLEAAQVVISHHVMTRRICGGEALAIDQQSRDLQSPHHFTFSAQTPAPC